MNDFELSRFDDVFAPRTTPEEWNNIRSLRDDPGFLNALFAYRDAIQPIFAENMILNKVVTEAWRFEILVYMLYLHDRRDEANPRSGLTLANLNEICARQKCASKGRVFSILVMMRMAGYLAPIGSGGDGRVLRLAPTDRFLAIVERWNAGIFAVIDSIRPELGLLQRHRAEPRFGFDMRSRGAEHLLTGWKLLDPFPEVAHFVTRDGGWMLLLACVAQGLRKDERLTILPVSLDLEAFGRRFAVSRSHLRRLLISAHDAGLLDSEPRNGMNIVLSPRLVASFLACMASELDFYRRRALGL